MPSTTRPSLRKCGNPMISRLKWKSSPNALWPIGSSCQNVASFGPRANRPSAPKSPAVRPGRFADNEFPARHPIHEIQVRLEKAILSPRAARHVGKSRPEAGILLVARERKYLTPVRHVATSHPTMSITGVVNRPWGKGGTSNKKRLPVASAGTTKNPAGSRVRDKSPQRLTPAASGGSRIPQCSI